MSFHKSCFKQEEVHLWEIKGNFIDFRKYTKEELVDLIESILTDLTLKEKMAVGEIMDFWIDELDAVGKRGKFR